MVPSVPRPHEMESTSEMIQVRLTFTFPLDLPSRTNNVGVETDELLDKSQTTLAVGQNRHPEGWEA